VLHKFGKQLKLEYDYSALSMRVTFITRALEKGAKLEVGHADPATTKLHDRRRFMREYSAASVVKY
jgi:hypothetical protein